MKIYLSLSLLALGAQPALASSQMASNDTAAIEPAGSLGDARRQELQRVADALSAEMGTKAGATTREPVEVLKARVKAMKRPAPSDAPPPCEDCPEKAAAPRPSSASQERNHDCIDCVEEAILA
ncbi:hypothetical protein [Sphingobium subterraneum]|uniref:TPP-dependent indolepyruvate ferredoxin oxidoreductase alpha subunit n=1 Tax=Sphingobium subterraneum TaxID=627688 RepID=A0A841J4X1_9SPHN|nr:hypothetical protein [Sphingobium subterraneum]MBB6125847.1 TPP-dependent indolepyruvate ferredoxin oxidoreductase alpha subunit [Sphingobium subterraneum]